MEARGRHPAAVRLRLSRGVRPEGGADVSDGVERTRPRTAAAVMCGRSGVADRVGRHGRLSPRPAATPAALVDTVRSPRDSPTGPTHPAGERPVSDVSSDVTAARTARDGMLPCRLGRADHELRSDPRADPAHGRGAGAVRSGPARRDRPGQPERPAARAGWSTSPPPKPGSSRCSPRSPRGSHPSRASAAPPRRSPGAAATRSSSTCTGRTHTRTDRYPACCTSTAAG